MFCINQLSVEKKKLVQNDMILISYDTNEPFHFFPRYSRNIYITHHNQRHAFSQYYV